MKTKEIRGQRYARNLIEATLDPLFTIDNFGNITDVNEAMVTAADKPREILIGTPFISYFIESELASDLFKKVFESGKVMNYPLTIMDGVLTDVLINGSIFKDEFGEALGAVIVARDITALKKIQKELTEAIRIAELATTISEEAKRKAESAALLSEEAVKAKQQFLSNMSHEIRTPMNAIIGFTKVVLKTELSAKQREYLTAIKMSGDSLIVLINDILDLAKVNSGKMTFEKTAFNLSFSISAILHLFTFKTQEKNIKLTVDFDKNLPTMLVGDPSRLNQILLNLLSNALKFTNNGEITLRTKLLEEDLKTVKVGFSVTDTGIGIPEDKIEKIFENFQQASLDTTRLYGGTGLGLAIVKHLVEPQGGSIKVASTVGKGSRFSFELPFEKTTDKALSKPEMIEPYITKKDIKVLVVEDIELNQLLMKSILDDFGFECDIVSNGKLAIEKLETDPYNIILMDLQMPVMNGFEATKHIRQFMLSDIPIIALTADVTTTDLPKCKAIGMNDYIAKPVDDTLLYSKIIGLVYKHTDKNDVPTANVYDTTHARYTNLDYLMLRTKSDPELLMEMISAYLTQTPPLIEMLLKSLQLKDWEMLKSTAHKLIPSFAIMGMHPDFATMAQNIQDNATEEQSNSITQLVTKIELACTQACHELKEELQNLKNKTQ